MFTTKILLANPTTLDQTGTEQIGPGYYGSKSVASISIETSAYLGRIELQGTLASSPSSSDWFTVQLDGDDYLQYDTANTSNTIYNVAGQFTWLRVVITRSYIGEITLETAGTIKRIILNY